jgi:ligand-binding sensor domain-containing protein
MISALLSGCATVLPPEYGPTGRDRELPGPILALGGEGDVIIAANPDGIHVRAGDGTWKKWEVPGIRNYGKVTTLAVRDGEICIGTDGDGLHIYKDDTWEVRTARYGGLADDSVLSIAYDGNREGLPGDNLWVGTGEGIAVRRSGEWSVYRPGKNWLTDLAGDEEAYDGKTYLGPGYDLGGKSEDSKYFKPPVTAIGVGPDRVVFGNSESRIAVVAPFGTATIFFPADADITSLLVEKSVVWVGTNGGLVWGGLKGVALGEPWPAHRMGVFWTGRLFDTRNSEPFLYRWHLVGYNTARVPHLSLDGDSLWVVYGKPDSRKPPTLTGETEENPIQVTSVRRYANIGDYIARKEAFVYESYGKNVGISGYPTVIQLLPDRGELWVGTTRGLYRLKR